MPVRVRRRAGIVCARQRIAVGWGQGEVHRLPRGNGCGLGLRCKRGRGFQNDAALHRRGCRGGSTACQQNQHGKNKHQAAQVEHILSEKICFLRQYRIILSADTASEVRQMLSQKRR